MAESEIYLSVMGGETKKSANKTLMVILGCLCCVMVVLIGVVVFNAVRVTDGEVGGGADVSVEEPHVFTSEGWDDAVFDESQDAAARATEMLKEDGISAAEIIDFYQTYIDKYIAEGNATRVSSYVWDRSDKLVLGGFKQEALDALLGMDLNAVGELDRYRQYGNIVALAEDLGREDVAEQYRNKLIEAGRGESKVIEIATERIRGLEQRKEEVLSEKNNA